MYKNIGIAIIDLDNFKRVNDVYGYDNCDKVLRTLGEVLNQKTITRETSCNSFFDFCIIS